MKNRMNLSIPTPAWFSTIGENVTITGWFVDEQGWPAKQVRIRLGDRIINCQIQARPEVLAQHKDCAIHDANIGFLANFRTKPGAKYITIEAQTRDGVWRGFAQRLFFVRKQNPDTQPRKHVTISETQYPRNEIKTIAAVQPVIRSHGGLAEQFRSTALASISIVMPTYNRAETLASVVRRTHELTKNQEISTEWIIVDDGSTDQTQAVLQSLSHDIPNLRYQTVKNGGPGQARNIGASLARNEVILFMGDDILPSDEDFLRIHAQLHAEHKSVKFAVLGKIIWPSNKHLDINATMRHIQGRGGEQFGYADFAPYSFYDWRFFYTANVSVKRHLVNDWKIEGFSSAFTAAAYEDGEFAYRMEKKHGEFRILYAPSSVGQHIHAYTVSGFIRRQGIAGAMAATFSKLHPEALPLLGVNGIRDASMSLLEPGTEGRSLDYLAAIEGIKAWAKILESEGHLGNQAWHEEILFAVFEVSYLQGYIEAAATATTNFERAYAHILSRLKIRMNRIFDSEARSDESFKIRMLAM